MWPLPALGNGRIGVERCRRGAAEQQVEAAGEYHHRQQLIEPGRRQPVHQRGAEQGADRGADQRIAPGQGGEQLAPVEGVAGGGRAKGGAQLVGAQHQVRRQAGHQ
ncbi:hypothetical protein D3C71_1548140 [compost metagenome]